MLILSLLAGSMLGGAAPWRSVRADEPKADASKQLFARDNLIAWCIVPFDSKKRKPEERAAMLEKLGFKHFAYDWRADDIPTFDAEIKALKKHGVSLDAFWTAPGELNRESRIILDVLKRNGVKAQLWALLDFGPDRTHSGPEQDRRVKAAADKLGPLAEEAAKIGCSVALYNHGGWFGEPENQIAIIERLKGQGISGVGIVYNLHHGHDLLDRFPALLARIKPYLVCLNLNGMDPGGDKVGRKILPLGQGELDLSLLRTILDSGYHGPIGILGHTMDDAEERLKDNLDGLDWLVPQLSGKAPGPVPKPRTPVPPRPAKAADVKPDPDAAAVARLIRDAREHGDPRRGADVFVASNFACISCHRVGTKGGSIGPDLTTVGACVPPEQIVEAVLWPKKKIKEGYAAIAVATSAGKLIQGYKQEERERDIVIRDAATEERVRIPKAEIDEIKEQGTLMPDGLAAAMTTGQRQDLIRFLLELGHKGGADAGGLVHHVQSHAPASFPYDRAPLRPEEWPNRLHRVNRDRLYDFYQKEAEYFRTRPDVPSLLPPYPGLDGGTLGHWGNQDEASWADARWNDADLGTLLSGVFRGAGVTIPKGICVRLGDSGELAACFDPTTLCYEALWRGGFVKFTGVRHGFMDGLLLDGTPLPRPEGEKPDKAFTYQGFFRNGKRVIFAYRIDGVDYLDAPWVKEGKFERIVAPADVHPLKDLTRGGAAQWTWTFSSKGSLGTSKPYALDTIEPPFDNPWKAPLFFGGHDFLPDGSALICTMQGDVWRVEGLDDPLARVRWRRFASGLHHALGLVVSDGHAYVLGRDQITRLRDIDGDGEADFYECFSNAYATSPAGHDFICGLERDPAGNFYTVSGRQGLIRISPDGKAVDVLATGFRNPDGLGLTADGAITVPNSEGEWVPTSMVIEVRPGGHYGYPGPKNNQPPDLPLVYLPRGLDNSSGGQVEVSSDRWGPIKGRLIHLSHGAGTPFLILRERVDGQAQGAAVPLPGDFLSGSHRGRFSPKDGQLYVTGMGGWGTYTPLDGCFQRLRYTGDPVRLPVEFHAHENGVLLRFSGPVDRAVAEQVRSHFAQVWNYRYSQGYGSLEFSPRHPGMPGHDPLVIRSAHVLADGRSLFLEIPDLQPVNQLHLRVGIDAGVHRDLFATVHKLAPPFTGFDGYRPSPKTISAHPILADMAALAFKPVPNPWATRNRQARPIVVEAGKNLTFATRSFKVKPGEPIMLTFANPDVVPHNWALIKPGTLPKVGDLINKIVAEPDAAIRNYIPRTDDVLVYTDVVQPSNQFIISFQAPTEKGKYPYLCTFPGHWMVMNGVMVVD
jgi:putative heme-binding domain-containing protein